MATKELDEYLKKSSSQDKALLNSLSESMKKNDVTANNNQHVLPPTDPSKANGKTQNEPTEHLHDAKKMPDAYDQKPLNEGKQQGLQDKKDIISKYGAKPEISGQANEQVKNGQQQGTTQQNQTLDQKSQPITHQEKKDIINKHAAKPEMAGQEKQQEKSNLTKDRDR